MLATRGDKKAVVGRGGLGIAVGQHARGPGGKYRWRKVVPLSDVIAVEHNVVEEGLDHVMYGCVLAKSILGIVVGY